VVRNWFVVALAVSAMGVARGAVVYDNTQTSQSYIVATIDWWDDATIVGGGVLSGFSIWAYNAQSGSPRVLTTQISIHLFDQANNLPNGTLLGSFTLTTPPVPAGQSLLASTGDLSGQGIELPQNARLGVHFDFTSNSGIVMYNPPVVGSSADAIWRDVPPVLYDVAGYVDNLGFGIQAVPEPSAVLLVFAGSLAALRLRRR
jgi:hypothetical protein